MGKLTSEKVVMEAPMSFAGAAKRAWRLIPVKKAARSNEGFGQKLLRISARVLQVSLVLLLIAVWWAAVAVWYAFIYTLWLLPTVIFRSFRRHSRKEKADKLRHAEMMEALKQKD